MNFVVLGTWRRLFDLTRKKELAKVIEHFGLDLKSRKVGRKKEENFLTLGMNIF